MWTPSFSQLEVGWDFLLWTRCSVDWEGQEYRKLVVNVPVKFTQCFHRLFHWVLGTCHVGSCLQTQVWAPTTVFQLSFPTCTWVRAPTPQGCCEDERNCARAKRRCRSSSSGSLCHSWGNRGLEGRGDVVSVKQGRSEAFISASLTPSSFF